MLTLHVMKNREYHYIQAKTATGYEYRTIPIESEDRHEGDLLLLAFPISEMNNIGEILAMFNYNSDTANFYTQCREVISAPEKHINEKGEGKLAFQSYFHNFPESVNKINDKAIVVVVLHPKDPNATGPHDYWLVNYIHANVYDFKDMNGNVREGFYYNILRVSERSENGQKVYRRKKIFTLVFSVLHSLVDEYGLHFAYAYMGKENQAIIDALVANSKKYNKHFERFPIRTNTTINLLYGKKALAAKVVNITNDLARQQEMYRKMIAQKGNYAFQAFHTEAEFLRMIENMKHYSKTSKVLMVPDASGNIDAACVAMNWGDYFKLTLENPRGFFKALASLELTDRILHPICICGSVEGVNTLLRGAAYIFRKNHKVQISLLNAYQGDPYWDVKKSIVFDETMYFVITDVMDDFEAVKKHSHDSAGNVRYSIDNPIL